MVWLCQTHWSIPIHIEASHGRAELHLTLQMSVLDMNHNMGNKNAQVEILQALP